MARVVEQSIDSRHRQHLVEYIQGVQHLCEAKVDQREDFEIEIPEQFGQLQDVRLWVGERSDRLIALVANEQSDLLHRWTVDRQ